MRAIIASAVPLGFRPAEVRAMIPRDWLLVKRGYDAAQAGARPGASAPSKAEVAALVEAYG